MNIRKTAKIEKLQMSQIGYKGHLLTAFQTTQKQLPEQLKMKIFIS